MNEPTYTVTPQPLPCVHHQSIKNMIAEAIKNLDEANPKYIFTSQNQKRREYQILQAEFLRELNMIKQINIWVILLISISF